MNSFFDAFAMADPFGKGIFCALFFLSILSWFFIIHKLYLIHCVRKSAKIFEAALRKNKENFLHISPETLPKIKQKSLPHPFGHLFLKVRQKTKEILDKNAFFSKGEDGHYLSRTDIDALEDELTVMIYKQRDGLEKNLFVLSTIIPIAPFLGLLGTVWGILITFSEMKAGGSMQSSSAMLGGLSTALTTTVLGLLIAIPARIAFNYFKNVSSIFAREMGDFSHFLLSTIDLQYRKTDL